MDNCSSNLDKWKEIRDEAQKEEADADAEADTQKK